MSDLLDLSWPLEGISDSSPCVFPPLLNSSVQSCAMGCTASYVAGQPSSKFLGAKAICWPVCQQLLVRFPDIWLFYDISSSLVGNHMPQLYSLNLTLQCTFLRSIRWNRCSCHVKLMNLKGVCLWLRNLCAANRFLFMRHDQFSKRKERWPFW